MTTKRDLERRLDELDAPGEEYPAVSLCQLLSSETHNVLSDDDDDRILVELDDGIFRVSQSMAQTITRTVEDD